MQIPDNLKSICDEFKSEYAAVIRQYEEGEGDISDILKAVRSYISRDTTYSESPGRTPSDRDTVEYFLKESKKGYCTYYATAAAILLRSVGIPTRYVEGLYISPDELNEGIPGEISIPDYDAHAWIEVYDPRYGFVTRRDAGSSRAPRKMIPEATPTERVRETDLPRSLRLRW